MLLINYDAELSQSQRWKEHVEKALDRHGRLTF